MDNCDVMFVCEHWLTPGELPILNTQFKSSDYWSSFKSSVNPEETLRGRPHGGVGFVAKRMSNISLKPIVIENERLYGIQLLSQGKVILTILGVYLPYFNGDTEQIDA